jgi:hypothetical protein
MEEGKVTVKYRGKSASRLIRVDRRRRGAQLPIKAANASSETNANGPRGSAAGIYDSPLLSIFMRPVADSLVYRALTASRGYEPLAHSHVRFIGR